MKATKRISAIFLALVLALSLLPVSVFAAGSDYSTRLLVDKVADDKVDVKWMVQTSNGAVMKTTNSIVFKYDHTKYDMLTNDGEVITTKTMSDNLCGEYVTSEYAQRVTVFDSPALWDNSGIYAEANGNWTFVLINLACSKPALKKEYTTETALAVIHLQLKSGAVGDGLPGGSIALATTTEASSCGQSGIVIFIGASEEQFIYGRTDGFADTLPTAPVVAPGTGVTFANPALTGSVSITGTPKIGETLTATPSGLPGDAGTLSYKWYRDGETDPISGVTGSTYTPNDAADVGKTIKVEVSAANYSGSVTATTTDTVKKADGPAAPTTLEVVSVTDTTITVTENASWEYSKDDGGTWQDSNVFTGLAPSNYYSQIVARVKETGTHKAGAKSATISATTTKGSAGADTITKLKATHTPYNETYDGTAHDALSVDAAALSALTGWSVAYSTNGTSYSSAMPKVTNVADSGKIYVKFANTSYADVIAEYDVTVSAKDIDGANIVFGTQATYDGTEKSVAISKVTVAGTDLTGVDYTVESGDKATDVGNNTLVIKGKGNYTGEARATWTLVAKDVTITPTSGLSKTYGAADPELTYTTDISDTALKTKFNDDVTGELAYTGEDVGAYPITLGSLAAGNNFKLKLAAATVDFTINQATPVITATTPRPLVKNGVEVDISDWASFNNTDSGAKLTYALDGTPTGITLTADNKLKADPSTTETTFNIKVNAAATTNFAVPTEKVIVVNVVTKDDAGVSITTPPTSKTYGDADFTLTATKSASASDGGTWTWNSSDDTILEIISGADTATPTIKVKKADTTGATLTVTYTSSTHYGSANATITVAQKEVTVAAGDYKVSKEYDRTTGIGTPSGALSVSGILSSDTVTVITAPVAYTDANVGGQYTMDVTINLVGTGNGNYKIKGGATTISVPCEITAKEVTVTGITATNRTYAKDNLKVDLTGGTLTGVISGDAVTVNLTNAKGTMTDANVGNGKAVTVTGVALGGADKGNYELKAQPTGVTVNITKATALTLADIPVSQKYTVTTGEKAIGAVMPAEAGTLTYTEGTASKTGSVTVTSWNVDPAGKVTYTLSGGAAGDTVTLPVIIKSTNYADTTVKVVITLTAKDDQAALTLTGETTVVYGQTLQLGTSGGSGNGAVTYTVTPGTGTATIDATGKLTPTKVGTVTVTATKAADANYNSGTSAPVTITITKATPTGEPKYTAITTSGKTLADAGLTTVGSTLNPNAGTLVWVDNAGTVLPDTTAVAANTTYKWLFTPTDTNYTTLTGSIQLWHKSTSSGGGSYYAPTVPDMPMLYSGCTGDAVKTLQEKLNAKGFDSGNVDGIFGAKTYAAVTAFQKANSLGVDGIVGKLTWAKLYDATPVNVTPVTTQPMLRTGSRGDAVRKLQELLNAKGYTCGSVDGIFGSKTYAAVLAFQKANGLAADGIVGSLTWGKLV